MAELAKKANQGLSGLATGPFATRPKHAPTRLTQGNSVHLTLRRLEGHGTLWLVFLGPLAIPTGANVFLAFPPVSYTSGAVFPASGDTDLFLSLNSPSAPSVRASVNAGLTPDAVTFSAFPFEFIPFFRLNGFRASVTSFAANGFGFP
jgi:hypothetical protein